MTTTNGHVHKSSARPAMRSARRPAVLDRALDGAPYDCRALRLLRASMRKFDLSDRHLARTLGTSTVTAQRILDGTAEPRASHMFRCRHVFRVPLDAWKTDAIARAEKAS